ncbi:hypothetical protein ABIC10_008921 [Bradyrhizobium sp. S3.2.12]
MVGDSWCGKMAQRYFHYSSIGLGVSIAALEDARDHAALRCAIAHFGELKGLAQLSRGS